MTAAWLVRMPRQPTWWRTLLRAGLSAMAATCSQAGRAWVVRAEAAPAEAAPTRLDAATAARCRALLLPHLDAAYNLARYLSRDGEAAQDIVQDAFVRALRGFTLYRGGDPRAWLLAIVRNCCRDWLQARARDRTEPAPGQDADDPDGDLAGLAVETVDGEPDTPEAALLRRQEALQVQSVLAALPEPAREMLVLRELEGLSYREIAAVTGVPIGTVMSRLARARGLFASAWRRRTVRHGEGA